MMQKDIVTVSETDLVVISYHFLRPLYRIITISLKAADYLQVKYEGLLTGSMKGFQAEPYCLYNTSVILSPY